MHSCEMLLTSSSEVYLTSSCVIASIRRNSVQAKAQALTPKYLGGSDVTATQGQCYLRTEAMT